LTFVPDKLTGNTINTVTSKYMDKYDVSWIQMVQSSFSKGFQQSFGFFSEDS